MPPSRASKRLKVAAEKAVATATTVVKETKTKTVRKTTSRAKKTVETAETTVVEATTTVETTASGGDEKKDTSSTTAAWGALFAKPVGGSKKAASGDKLWPRPKRSGPLTDDVQAKIKAYAAFEGVEASPSHKIVAWNVNGLRAMLKKEETVHFRAYVAQEDPDVLCLGETKIDSVELQKLDDVLPQYEHQYWSSAVKKGYSGTVVFSKVKPISIKDEIIVENGKPDDEGRFLALEFDTYWLVHTYVPNSGMKLDRLSYRTEKWDKAMLKMLQELEKTKPVVWCGDLNVAHENIDIHDPKTNRNKSPGFTDAERESFGDILSHGFVDSFRHLNPEKIQYSYWNYRFDARTKNKGWRIDYCVVSESLLSRVENSFVRDKVTGSDHVPVGILLKHA